MQSLGPALAEFKADDNIKSSASSDPEILGMQLAMIEQSACGDELIQAASQRFQRGWFEAVVLERAAAKRCGWPKCESYLKPSLRNKLQAARTGDDLDSYCSTACFRMARGYAQRLPYKVGPATILTSSASRVEKKKKMRARPAVIKLKTEEWEWRKDHTSARRNGSQRARRNAYRKQVILHHRRLRRKTPRQRMCEVS